jgi:hypothetical protein
VKWLALAFVLLLAGCGSLPQPFSKEQPLSIRDPLVAPPWQAMVKAGPNASKEIDLETLNGTRRIAEAPPMSADAESVAAADEKPKQPLPDGRVAITAVAVLSVQGDGAKGNEELTQAMRDTLEGAGWQVRKKPAKDALTIQGKVELAKSAGATQQVKLSWIVAKPNGEALGTVDQANNIPAGSLANGWGPNARAAAEAAASGIFDLINKFR